MVKCGFGAFVFERVLGKPALFFLLRICCITHPACLHILNRKKRRSAAAHACLPRKVLPPLAQETKHGGSKIHQFSFTTHVPPA